MKTSITIVMAILILIPAVSGTTITDVRWNANLKVIEILFDKFPDKWGGWTMYVDGEEWPMEGGPGKAIVRPNAAVEKATGLFVGTEPWPSGLEKVNFPCCGTIQFSIPGEGPTDRFQYDLTKDGCKTTSSKACVIAGLKVVIAVPLVNATSKPDSGIKLEDNVDLPGMNLKPGYVLSSPDPQLCANDCAKNPDCKAFTYVKPGFREPNSPPECWLKKGVPNPVPQKYCTSGIKAGAQNVDWNNIPGQVLHLFHNVNQGDPQLEPTKPNMYFFGAFDLSASPGEGYCWWQVYDNPNADPDDWSNKLPSGLVLALLFYEQMAGDGRVTSFGVSPDQEGTYAYGFLLKQEGYDLEEHTSAVGKYRIPFSVYWFETYNPDFSNWDEAEKNLPKGTVLGLKHTSAQPDKKVTWRGQEYDPVNSYRDRIASPPTFTARHGGDLGAPSGEGFYWYEKTTGPDFFQPRG
jgi:hypothetical protein